MNESLNNITTIIKNTSNLISTLQTAIDKQMAEGKIDSQSIYALTKLIDSLVKLHKTEREMKESDLYEDNERTPPPITEDEKTIFRVYRDKLFGPDVIKIAPRAEDTPLSPHQSSTYSKEDCNYSTAPFGEGYHSSTASFGEDHHSSTSSFCEDCHSLTDAIPNRGQLPSTLVIPDEGGAGDRGSHQAQRPKFHKFAFNE